MAERARCFKITGKNLKQFPQNYT